jgi:hypothetical protein
MSLVDVGVLVVCSGAVGHIGVPADTAGRDWTNAVDVRSSWPFSDGPSQAYTTGHAGPAERTVA